MRRAGLGNSATAHAPTSCSWANQAQDHNSNPFLSTLFLFFCRISLDIDYTVFIDSKQLSLYTQDRPIATDLDTPLHPRPRPAPQLGYPPPPNPPTMSTPTVLPNVLGLIGHTPLVRLDKIAKEHNLKCNLLAKLEGFSAGGSVKVSSAWLRSAGARLVRVAEVWRARAAALT